MIWEIMKEMITIIQAPITFSIGRERKECQIRSDNLVKQSALIGSLPDECGARSVHKAETTNEEEKPTIRNGSRKALPINGELLYR